MTILAIFTGSISKSQYEAVRKEVQWEQQAPPGGVFHAASFDGAGQIHVVDIWESPESMNAFFEKRLLPAMQKLNVTPPDAAVFPIHNINAYKAMIGKYEL